MLNKLLFINWKTNGLLSAKWGILTINGIFRPLCLCIICDRWFGASWLNGWCTATISYGYVDYIDT